MQIAVLLLRLVLLLLLTYIPILHGGGDSGCKWFHLLNFADTGNDNPAMRSNTSNSNVSAPAAFASIQSHSSSIARHRHSMTTFLDKYWLCAGSDPTYASISDFGENKEKWIAFGSHFPTELNTQYEKLEQAQDLCHLSFGATKPQSIRRYGYGYIAHRISSDRLDRDFTLHHKCQQSGYFDGAAFAQWCHSKSACAIPTAEECLSSHVLKEGQLKNGNEIASTDHPCDGIFESTAMRDAFLGERSRKKPETFALNQLCIFDNFYHCALAPQSESQSQSQSHPRPRSRSQPRSQRLRMDGIKDDTIDNNDNNRSGILWQRLGTVTISGFPISIISNLFEAGVDFGLAFSFSGYRNLGLEPHLFGNDINKRLRRRRRRLRRTVLSSSSATATATATASTNVNAGDNRQANNHNGNDKHKHEFEFATELQHILGDKLAAYKQTYANGKRHLQRQSLSTGGEVDAHGQGVGGTEAKCGVIISINRELANFFNSDEADDDDDVDSDDDDGGDFEENASVTALVIDLKHHEDRRQQTHHYSDDYNYDDNYKHHHQHHHHHHQQHQQMRSENTNINIRNKVAAMAYSWNRKSIRSSNRDEDEEEEEEEEEEVDDEYEEVVTIHPPYYELEGPGIDSYYNDNENDSVVRIHKSGFRLHVDWGFEQVHPHSSHHKYTQNNRRFLTIAVSTMNGSTSGEPPSVYYNSNSEASSSHTIFGDISLIESIEVSFFCDERMEVEIMKPPSIVRIPIPPTFAPTTSPTHTHSRTHSPSRSPTTTTTTTTTTSMPTKTPSKSPPTTTTTPTSAPTNAPSTAFPSISPTAMPSQSPTKPPTNSPQESPTISPTDIPTVGPTDSPSESQPPTQYPSKTPSNYPTTNSPTNAPSSNPTETPTDSPTKSPTDLPSDTPSSAPSTNPSEKPVHLPTQQPTNPPTRFPSKYPSKHPSKTPTKEPTLSPSTKAPSIAPSSSANPSNAPSSSMPSHAPITDAPSTTPTHFPTGVPSSSPTAINTNSTGNTVDIQPSQPPTEYGEVAHTHDIHAHTPSATTESFSNNGSSQPPVSIFSSLTDFHSPDTKVPLQFLPLPTYTESDAGVAETDTTVSDAEPITTILPPATTTASDTPSNAPSANSSAFETAVPPPTKPPTTTNVTSGKPVPSNASISIITATANEDTKHLHSNQDPHRMRHTS